MWFGQRDEWERIGNPEIDPYKYTQQIFDKVAETDQWRKDGSLKKKKSAGAIGYP